MKIKIEEKGNARGTGSIFSSGHEIEKWKMIKPSAPRDGQIKKWTNREGTERGEQRQNYPWSGGAKLLKTNMAATTVRTSATDDL